MGLLHELPPPSPEKKKKKKLLSLRDMSLCRNYWEKKEKGSQNMSRRKVEVVTLGETHEISVKVERKDRERKGADEKYQGFTA